MSFRVVIPARLGATRLPGKPLLDVAGKPLVVRVLERALASAADEVIVATDDATIASVVAEAGGRTVMTSPTHRSGTDRIAEVAATLGFADDDVVVNLQGDEPLVPVALLDALAAALRAHEDAAIATLATPILDGRELVDPNVVKVVRDDAGSALAFSRAPIPWVREAFAGGVAPGPLPRGVPFLRHLGLYAYRAATLARLARAPESVLEAAEKLEQLRALAIGMRIHVDVVDSAPEPGVDGPDDLERVRRAYAEGRG